MKVSVKYLILITGFVAVGYSLKGGNIGSGIAAAGAFIAFAIIEIQDVKFMNEEEK